MASRATSEENYLYSHDEYGRLLSNLNALLSILGIPLALESLYEITPSLLLAIVESLLGTRLPIPDPSPVHPSSRRNLNLKKLTEIQTTKLVLGTLETDVFKTDVGLSKIDPEKLAEGREKEVLAVAKVLCLLLDSDDNRQQEEEGYTSSPRTATTTTKRGGEWTPRAPADNDLRLLSFEQPYASGLYRSRHADLSPLISSSPQPRLNRGTSTRRNVVSSQRSRPRCIHEIPSPSVSGTCDCSFSPSPLPNLESLSLSFHPELRNSSTPRKIRPRTPPNATPTESSVNASPTKSPLKPRLGGLINKVDLEEEIKMFDARQRRRRDRGGLVHPEGVSGDTTTSSDRDEVVRAGRSNGGIVKNPILPSSLSSFSFRASASGIRSEPGRVSTDSLCMTDGLQTPLVPSRRHGLYRNHHTPLDPDDNHHHRSYCEHDHHTNPSNSRKAVKTYPAAPGYDPEDPQSVTVALLRERARLLGELARVQARDALSNSWSRMGMISDMDEDRG